MLSLLFAMAVAKRIMVSSVRAVTGSVLFSASLERSSEYDEEMKAAASAVRIGWLVEEEVGVEGMSERVSE